MEPNTAVMPTARRRSQFFPSLVPLCSAVALLAIVVGISLARPTALSGAKYAEFAVRIHSQRAQRSLTFGIRSDSSQAVDDWLRQNAQLAAALPAATETTGEKRPYLLEGAGVVQVEGKRAAFIAYRVNSAPASLLIAPNAVAVASGGVEAHFNKVTFHYRMVDGFKVVTWSQHGLTYALVSQEGTTTQRSCMVCHSAMRDRDLSQTPTPLSLEKKTIQSFLQ